MYILVTESNYQVRQKHDVVLVYNNSVYKKYLCRVGILTLNVEDESMRFREARS